MISTEFTNWGPKAWGLINSVETFTLMHVLYINIIPCVKQSQKPCIVIWKHSNKSSKYLVNGNWTAYKLYEKQDKSDEDIW